MSTFSDALEAGHEVCLDLIDEVDYTTSKTEEVAKVLESDCVCEKSCSCGRSEPFVDRRKKDVLTCWKCALPISKEEKQSQSPCEHPKDSREFLLFNCQIPRTLEHTSRLLYLCHKCGLVTCLDPNRSGPSKNPNDK